MARSSYALLGILVVGQAGCTQRLTSHWTESPVEVDGDGREWAEVATYHFEDEPYLFAVQNDAQTLFLLFSTSSRPLIQLLRRVGLTVWLDEKGNEEKRRGARIWLAGGGLPRPAAAGLSDRGPGESGEPGREPAPPPGRELESVPPGRDLVPPDREPVFPRPTVVPVGTVAALGPPIRVAQSFYRGVLSVEVEVPLLSPIAGSRAVSLGFELPAALRQPERMQGRKSKGRMRGGGMGGMDGPGGGLGGMDGGMAGGGMGGMAGGGMDGPGAGMGGMGGVAGGGVGGERDVAGDGRRGRGRTNQRPAPQGLQQPELRLEWVTVEIPPPTASVHR